MGELAQKITGALEAIVNLHIITVVGKVTVTNAFNRKERNIDIAPDQQAMVTSIDLAQGDITNGLDAAFAPGSGDDAMREFHERQVKLGNEIIRRNLELLKEMATEIIELTKKEDEP